MRKTASDARRKANGSFEPVGGWPIPKIPQKIKVVGFNNDPISNLITPTLSTIDYQGYNMGLLAAESIIGQLKGNINFQTANTISLRHQLIVRESSSKIDQ